MLTSEAEKAGNKDFPAFCPKICFDLCKCIQEYDDMKKGSSFFTSLLESSGMKEVVLPDVLSRA